MWKTSSKPRDRHGLTLVEVVAGLALLATLLVSILMAFSAHAGQIRAAQDRLQAIEIADALLTRWTASDGIPAVGREDAVPGSEALWWRIVVSPSVAPSATGLHTVRLEVFERPANAPQRIVTSTDLFLMDKPSEATP